MPSAWRRALFSCFALLSVATVRVGAANVQVVVALCKEQRHHFLRTIVETVLWEHNVSLVTYAKCGPHPSFPGSTELENVGREGHTYFHHMAALLDIPPGGWKPDLVVFINGGSGSKGHHTVAEVFQMAHNLASANASQYWYGDFSQTLLATQGRRGECRNEKGFHVAGAPPSFAEQPVETARAFVALARAQCSDSQQCCELCNPDRCCLSFGPDNICPRSSQRLFDEPVGCEYLGRTRENYVGVYPMPLAPAAQPNFVEWLAAWGVHFKTWESVRWAHEGNFAVSMQAIEAFGAERARRGMAELKAAGVSGGMVGMYVERAWRAFFIVHTCDSWQPRP